MFPLTVPPTTAPPPTTIPPPPITSIHPWIEGLDAVTADGRVAVLLGLIVFLLAFIGWMLAIR